MASEALTSVETVHASHHGPHTWPIGPAGRLPMVSPRPRAREKPGPHPRDTPGLPVGTRALAGLHRNSGGTCTLVASHCVCPCRSCWPRGRRLPLPLADRGGAGCLPGAGVMVHPWCFRIRAVHVASGTGRLLPYQGSKKMPSEVLLLEALVTFQGCRGHMWLL